MATTFQRRFLARPRSKTLRNVPDQLTARVVAEDNSVAVTTASAEKLLGMASTSAPSYRTMHVTPTIALDPRLVARCFDVLTEGVPYACEQRLNAELSRNGLQFTSNEEELQPTAEMQSWVDNVLEPLRRDAIRAICAIGVVPIGFRRNEVNGQIIPYVPKPKTYTIAVGSVRGVGFYQLHWLSGNWSRDPVRLVGPDGPSHNDRLVVERRFGERMHGTPDPSIVVLTGFNFDPDVDGRICSPVMSFMRSAMRGERFMAAADVAESINSNPPILRQYDGKTEAASHKALAGTEWIGEGVVDPTSEQSARMINKTYLRDERQIAAYKIQEKLIRRHYSSMLAEIGEESDAGTTFTQRPSNGLPMPWDNECALPEEWKTATYHLPRPRGDLVAVLNHFDDEIFRSFLIPRQAFDASSGVTANADTAKEALEVAVSVWRQTIGRVLTYAHDGTFMQGDIEAALRDVMKRNQAGDEPSGRDELKQRVSDEQLRLILGTVGTVRVGYRSKPPTSVETLDRLRARGIIKWAQYAQGMAQVGGIDPTAVEPDDPLPEEAQRIVGLPAYADYLRIIEERKRAAEVQAEPEEKPKKKRKK